MREQAARYAAEGNYRGVVLTNGTAWNLYHLTFEEASSTNACFAVDLSTDDGVDQAAECLALLHRTAIRKEGHEAHWQHRLALNAASIGKTLSGEEVLRLVRRDIRKREGLLVDEEDLATALHEMFSPEARVLIGPMRIPRRRKPAKKEPGPVTVEDVLKNGDVEIA